MKIIIAIFEFRFSLTHVKFADVVPQRLHVDTLCSQAETLITELFDPIVDLRVIRIQNNNG